MLKLNSFLRQRVAPWPALACLATLIVFGWVCSHFYLPGKGFTYLVDFGERQHARYLPELNAINHYELTDSDGYDAQWYAQIAMHPHLGDPQLSTAVDNLPYRARRILFCWTAWLLAGGNASRALHVYAAQNMVAWFLFAVLLWRWLPPNRLGNWVRWTGVLFSFGLCCCVRGSLVDGPSVLILAAAMALLEEGRAGWATVVLGFSGLAKETNLLAAGAWLPERFGDFRGWLRALGRIALAALPLVAWIALLTHRFGAGGGFGNRNFDLPFVGYIGKWREVAGVYRTHGFDFVVRGDLIVLVALTAQWLYFALRPRWSDPWWRLGAVYAGLMVFLGAAVWEGYPGAAPRVLLPMLLAFNLRVPRGRAWWIVLLAGNLSVFVAADTMNPPGRESYVVAGPRDLRIDPDNGAIVEAVFGPGWYLPEKSWLQYWRWCGDGGDVAFRNPRSFPMTADISFGLRANDGRTVAVRAGTATLWMGRLERSGQRQVEIRNVRLPPGDTVWHFESLEPPIRASAVDARQLSFSLRDLKIDLHR